MTKSKKLLFTFILFLCSFFPVFCGCSYTTQLASPELTLFSADNCIAFQSVAGTNTYDIYCNNELYETYENDVQAKSILYDFSDALTADGKYEFYVIAVSNSLYLNDSEPSNVVEVNYTAVSTPAAPPVEEDETVMEFRFVDGNKVSYDAVEGENIEYYIYLDSNTTEPTSYPVTTTIVNLGSSEFSLKHEIYAVRMGYKDGDETYISSTIKYYNPDKCSPYTDNIYIFDGFINDYYISSKDELNNIMYYTYINRIENFDIKLSSSMQSLLESYGYTYMVDNLNYVIDDAMGSYFETQNYCPANVNGGYAQQKSDASEFNIKVSYYGVKECDITIPVSSSSVYTQGKNGGYYDSVGYEMLGSDFNNFVSDHYFLNTTCSTSEQLYWAVENKITPIVVEGSRADIIYNKAKDVLREIISPEMNDYEKALSIFDWIAINTNYDYTDYDSVYRGGIALGNIPMYLPCFYLEGVFMTGYSVCDGFSKAYSLMCNMIGIDSIRIVGTAETNGSRGGHAWNKVLIDKDGEGGEEGKYYLVDITWTEILSYEDEVLSHLYFLLSDAEVEETHFNFAGRKTKFDKYAAPESYYYYDNSDFTYYNQETKISTTYDWVIENNTEMKDLFYYTLDNALSSVEYVVDIDYMVSYYDYVKGVGAYRAMASSDEVEIEYYAGTTLPKTVYEYATDTLYAYSYMSGETYVKEYKYYKLRETFVECMRSLKFNEQYFTITNYEGEVVYNENGSVAVLYVLEQNLCIDNKNDREIADEVKDLFEYLSNSNIVGEFALYVDKSIFTDVKGNSYTSKLQNLISTVLADTDMTFNISYDCVEDDMHKFKLVILSN